MSAPIPLTRHTLVVPGYDCMTTPCGKNGCGTRPGASHGRHCDDWLFVVSDGEVALSLTVFSGSYPRGVSRAPEGATLSLHASFATNREQATEDDRPSECEWVDAGRCFGAGYWGLRAGEFWTREHTCEAADQGERFWLALEQMWHEEAAKVRVSRVEVCPHCKGEGTRPVA